MLSLQEHGTELMSEREANWHEQRDRNQPAAAHTRTVGLDAIEDCSKVAGRAAERIKHAPHGDKHELLSHGAAASSGIGKWRRRQAVSLGVGPVWREVLHGQSPSVDGDCEV